MTREQFEALKYWIDARAETLRDLAAGDLMRREVHALNIQLQHLDDEAAAILIDKEPELEDVL